jgi:uncharacterized protein
MVKSTIEADLKNAMLSGDKDMVNTLRTLKGVILDAEIAAGKRDTGLADEEVVALLQKELKKRNEAIALYKQGGNETSAAEEAYEADVIKTYLPKQLDEAEVTVLIDDAIGRLENEPGMQAMGTIIGAVKAKAGGAVDGAMVARLVKERLSK